MNYRTYKPCPLLQPYVECFWVLEFGKSGESSPPERVLPDGKTELLVHFGDTFEKQNEKGVFERQGRALFAGQLKTFTTLRATGSAGMVAVRFKPVGAARFFDFPQNEITDKVVGLEEVLGNDGARLCERVLNARNNDHRVQVLSDFLIRCLEGKRDDILLRASVRFIEESQGDIDFDWVAKKVGLSTRQIERKFKVQIGISPASFVRVLRFHRFLELAKRTPAMKLTDAALECGYYDQSHFIRDFKAFAGLSPSTFLLESHQLSDHFVGLP